MKVDPGQRPFLRSEGVPGLLRPERAASGPWTASTVEDGRDAPRGGGDAEHPGGRSAASNDGSPGDHLDLITSHLWAPCRMLAVASNPKTSLSGVVHRAIIAASYTVWFSGI